MTVEELRKSLHDQYGLTPWPSKIYVDPNTYANVCHYIFSKAIETDDPSRLLHCNLKVGGSYIIDGLALGPHKGIMYKNVEVILRPYDEVAGVITEADETGKQQSKRKRGQFRSEESVQDVGEGKLEDSKSNTTTNTNS